MRHYCRLVRRHAIMLLIQGLIGNMSGKNRSHVNLGQLFGAIRRLREGCIRTSRQEHALAFWTVLFVWSQILKFELWGLGLSAWASGISTWLLHNVFSVGCIACHWLLRILPGVLHIFSSSRGLQRRPRSSRSGALYTLDGNTLRLLVAVDL